MNRILRLSFFLFPLLVAEMVWAMPSADSNEANNDLANATSIATPASFLQENLSIHTGTDVDYFTFTAPGVELNQYEMELTLTFSHAAGDVDVEVLDDQSNQIAQGISTTDNEVLLFTVSGEETYTIIVDSVLNATNTYSLELKINTLVRNTDGGNTFGSLYRCITGGNLFATETGTTAEIRFDFASPQTITLSEELPIIDQDMFLNNDTGFRVEISGNDTHRLLIGFDCDIRLESLILRNGMDSSVSLPLPAFTGGGALHITDGTLRVENCEFLFNQTEDGKFVINTAFFPTYGGALYSSGSAVILRNCLFQGNQTGNGLDSVPGDASTSGGHGGAVYLYLSQVLVEDCQFISNQTGSAGGENTGQPTQIGGQGGALHLDLATGSITGCLFQENRAGDGGNALDMVSLEGGNGGEGGAIFWRTPTSSPGFIAEIESSVFDRNRSGNGGDGVTATSPDSDGGDAGEGGNGAGVSIYTQDTNTVTLKDCTFLANITGEPGSPGAGMGSGTAGEPAAPGNAAANFGTASTAGNIRLLNLTFTQNQCGSLTSNPQFSSHQISAIQGDNTVDVLAVHCTIAGNIVTQEALPANQKAAAIRHVKILNSIVAHNRLPTQSSVVYEDLSPSFHADGVNFATVASGINSGAGILILQDPELGDLQDNGGPVHTIRPNTHSPVVNHPSAVFTALSAMDARGVPRTMPDIGAVELTTIRVNSLNDFYDGLATGMTSLRDALTDASVTPYPEPEIGFDTTVFNQEFQTITLTQGPLTASVSGLRVDARFSENASAPMLQISGNDTSRVLHVLPAGDLTLQGIELSGGLSDTPGGGILNQGILSLEECLVQDNRTSDGLPGQDATGGILNAGDGTPSANGGGIFNEGTLSIAVSMIRENQTGLGGIGGNVFSPTGNAGKGGSSGHGGGIANTGTLLISRSQILSNRTGNGGRGGAESVSAPADGGTSGLGGGIYNSGNGIVQIDNSTFTDNLTGKGGTGGESSQGDGGDGGHAGDGAAIAHVGRELTVTRSLFNENQTGDGGDGSVGLNQDGDGGNGGFGGAIYGFGVTSPGMRLTSTTIHQNQCGTGGTSPSAFAGIQGSGGGIFTHSSLPSVFSHLTVTENESADGGLSTDNTGSNPALVLDNSIVDQNLKAGGVPGDTEGGFELYGENIIGAPGTGASNGSGQRVPGPALLTPLQNWGGFTFCRYPYPGSPAVDAALATAFTPQEGQRGMPRAVGIGADIGAVESRVGFTLQDSDNDTMDDRLEVVFGLNVGEDDSQEDADGDRQSNVDELDAFAHPTNAASVFGITSLEETAVPGQYQVTWYSWPSLTYDIRRYTTLLGTPQTSTSFLVRPGQAVSQETTETFTFSQPVQFIGIEIP